MQSAAPPARARARTPLTQPHRRYIRCCVVRPRHARRHGRIMNLILMWSRRWRRRRPTSPWRRRCDQARVYAPREGAAAVSRLHRLRRAGRRLQARARRTLASTSTRKPPVSCRQSAATSGRLQRGAERLRWSWWNVTRRPSSCRYRFSFGRGTWPSVAGCIGSGMPFGQLRRPRPTTVQVASSETRGSLGRSGPPDVTPPRQRTSRTRFAYAVPSGTRLRPRPWPPINGASFETRGLLTSPDPSNVTLPRRGTSRTRIKYVGPVGTKTRRSAAGRFSRGSQGYKFYV